MALLPAVLVPVIALHIAGATVPLSTFRGVPKVAVDLIGKAPPKQTIKDAIPVVEAISDVFVPGAGIAIAVVFFAIEHSKPPTAEDQQRMWDQAQGIR